MSKVDEASAWIYQGVWRILSDWFRVPKQPPSLPAREQDNLRTFRPAEGFLRYLKFHFWLWLVVIDLAILIVWLVITVAVPWLGLLLAVPAFLLAAVPDIVAYVGVHLRYDTTWYVVSDRSLRIRRGIWIIHETTITFENIQNIKVTQGPLQRWFGITNLVVETAGGGGATAAHGGGASTAHVGLIEGVDNAQELRSLIFDRVGIAKTTGLGDEEETGLSARRFSRAQLEVLREIRSLAARLVSANA